MSLRAVVVCVVALLLACPAAAQSPPAEGAPGAQVDKPDAPRGVKRKGIRAGRRRERRARRIRRSSAGAPASLYVHKGPAHDPANGDDVPPPEAGPAAAPLPLGEYRGVRPGKVALPPNPPKGGGVPQLTWSGFMMTDGGSRVFLQFTQPVQYSLSESAKEVVVTIKGARIHKRNNGRVLKTGYFATPVLRVQARQHGKDVRVTLHLRRGARPTAHLEAGEQGYQFLMLDFPPTGEAPSSAPAE